MSRNCSDEKPALHECNGGFPPSTVGQLKPGETCFNDQRIVTAIVDSDSAQWKCSGAYKLHFQLCLWCGVSCSGCAGKAAEETNHKTWCSPLFSYVQGVKVFVVEESAYTQVIASLNKQSFHNTSQYITMHHSWPRPALHLYKQLDNKWPESEEDPRYSDVL